MKLDMFSAHAFVSQPGFGCHRCGSTIFFGTRVCKPALEHQGTDHSHKQWRATAKERPQSHCTNNSNKLHSRRQVISWIGTLPVALGAVLANAAPDPYEKVYAPPYDAVTNRRYVGIGRPPPNREPPKFEPNKKVFDIDDDLVAQDVQVGNEAEKVKPGSLVVARWAVILDDGTLIDASNEKQAAMFRPGAHQVPPGVEDSVLGMSPGGTRRIKGTAQRVLANVTLGYDIGERSLVPNDSTLFIDITVDRINPYGSGR